MRISEVSIHEWRHFQDITLSLGDDARLVCVVGANGTGKSHLLELIAGCAHRLGLSQGVETSRGDPFADRHDFALRFHLACGVSPAVDNDLFDDPCFRDWDRSLTIVDRNTHDPVSQIIAGGISGPNAVTFAGRVVSQLRQSEEVYFLSLDADRAYPKKNINVNELALAYDIDWAGMEYTRGRSFKTTTTLYDEWIKYFLAQENQAGTRLIQANRRSKATGQPVPEFIDHFAVYAESLQKILPHIVFSGVDAKHRKLLFDTTGLELSFDQLSGGEREIAFLVGQIDRFGLRKGLFLLDEPELHLNADLIRTWVAYLVGTVSTGQIWLATHSLEAVEAAGQHATFVFERNEHTRRVDSVARLDSRPLLSVLSRSVGTPAFSISQQAFVFVEGEEGVGERERFRRLCDVAQGVRFIECGSCNEVVRRVAAIKAIGKECDIEIRIGGVVDRDFRCEAESRDLRNVHGVFVLQVHEVENLYLHPNTLGALLAQNNVSNRVPSDLIRDAADLRAGSWIFQHAMSTRNAKSLPEVPAHAKHLAKSLTWENVNADCDNAVGQIVKGCCFDQDESNTLAKILTISVNTYEKTRTSADLWRTCEGKQALNQIARQVGFVDASAMMRASFGLWERDPSLVPNELADLRSYVQSL
jgi:predicted ATPase